MYTECSHHALFRGGLAGRGPRPLAPPSPINPDLNNGTQSAKEHCDFFSDDYLRLADGNPATSIDVEATAQDLQAKVHSMEGVNAQFTTCITSYKQFVDQGVWMQTNNEFQKDKSKSLVPTIEFVNEVQQVREGFTSSWAGVGSQQQSLHPRNMRSRRCICLLFLLWSLSRRSSMGQGLFLPNKINTSPSD